MVTKCQFSPLLAQAWLKALIPSSIIHGFRGTGIPRGSTCQGPFCWSLHYCWVCLQFRNYQYLWPHNSQSLLWPHKSQSLLQPHNSQSLLYTSLSLDSILLNHHYSAKVVSNTVWRGLWFVWPKYLSWLELHHHEAVPADCYLLSPAVDSPDFFLMLLHLVNVCSQLLLLPPVGVCLSSTVVVLLSPPHFGYGGRVGMCLWPQDPWKMYQKSSHWCTGKCSFCVI